MASKRDLRSYFTVSEDVSKDFRISVPEIISSASDDVSHAEVNMTKDLKNQVAKGSNYQNIPEKIRKEVER